MIEKRDVTVYVLTVFFGQAKSDHSFGQAKSANAFSPKGQSFHGRACRWATLGELKPKGPKGSLCDPKGSRDFLQNKFQCPPMVGVSRTLRA